MDAIDGVGAVSDRAGHVSGREDRGSALGVGRRGMCCGSVRSLDVCGGHAVSPLEGTAELHPPATHKIWAAYRPGSAHRDDHRRVGKDRLAASDACLPGR